MHGSSIVVPIVLMAAARSYPSAALWFFTALVVVAFGIIVLFEGLDALHALRRRLARAMAGGPEVEPADVDGVEEEGRGLKLREPDTKLRERHHRRVRPIRRTWEGGQANDPSRHW